MKTIIILEKIEERPGQSRFQIRRKNHDNSVNLTLNTELSILQMQNFAFHDNFAALSGFDELQDGSLVEFAEQSMFSFMDHADDIALQLIETRDTIPPTIDTILKGVC